MSHCAQSSHLLSLLGNRFDDLGRFEKVLVGICFLTIGTSEYFSKFNLGCFSLKGNIFYDCIIFYQWLCCSVFLIKKAKFSLCYFDIDCNSI